MNEDDSSALDFAYVTLQCSNHKPRREAFESLARLRGVSPEDFEAWAKDKQWWREES